MNTIFFRIVAIVFLALLPGLPAAAQDEVQTFNAFSVATANGSIIKTGDKQMSVVASIAGPFFVESDEGPLDAGRVTCIATVKVDQATASQSGAGTCAFTAADGAQSWGTFECTGFALVGCHGVMKINGGSGRLEGASGEGAMTWRPSAHEFSRQLDGATLQNSAGLLIWRDFKLSKKK